MVRRHYRPQLRKLFAEQITDRAFQQTEGAGISVYPGSVRLTCEFPLPEGFRLPASWSARFFERIEWPTPRKFLGYDRHPFRLFLEVRRGSRKFTVFIHDLRDRWLGPTHKVRLRFIGFPMEPPLALSTYIVLTDELTDRTLCQWLTVILAQRSMLSNREEHQAIEEFFCSGSPGDRERSVRLEAYRVLKERFVQPLGGHPSFPAYYQRTLRKLRLRQDMEYRERQPIQTGDYLQLRELRWSEPNLYRALLDRIADGKVKAEERDKQLWIKRSDADRIEEERLRNAEARQARRFPGKRVHWINQLVSRGEKRASAQRKVKRWINQMGLSEEEIKTSILRGRVVIGPMAPRQSPPDQPFQ